MMSRVSTQDATVVLDPGAMITDAPPVQILPGDVVQSVLGIKHDLTRQLLHALENLPLTAEEPAQAVLHLGRFFQTQIIDRIAERRAELIQAKQEERERISKARADVVRSWKNVIVDLSERAEGILSDRVEGIFDRERGLPRFRTPERAEPLPAQLEPVARHELSRADVESSIKSCEEKLA